MSETQQAMINRSVRCIDGPLAGKTIEVHPDFDTIEAAERMPMTPLGPMNKDGSTAATLKIRRYWIHRFVIGGMEYRYAVTTGTSLEAAFDLMWSVYSSEVYEE